MQRCRNNGQVDVLPLEGEEQGGDALRHRHQTLVVWGDERRDSEENEHTHFHRFHVAEFNEAVYMSCLKSYLIYIDMLLRPAQLTGGDVSYSLS